MSRRSTHYRAPPVPVVFARTEVQQVLGELTGVHRLMAQLLYGSGLRLMECAHLVDQVVEDDRHVALPRAIR